MWGTNRNMLLLLLIVGIVFCWFVLLFIVDYCCLSRVVVICFCVFMCLCVCLYFYYFFMTCHMLFVLGRIKNSCGNKSTNCSIMAYCLFVCFIGLYGVFLCLLCIIMLSCCLLCVCCVCCCVVFCFFV